MNRLLGRHAFAPYLCKGIPRVVKVTYGSLGYELVTGKEFKTFDQAEDAAEAMNIEAGIHEDDVWEIVENTLFAV